MTLFYLCIGGGLFVLGLHSLLLRPHWLRAIMAINIMGSGVFMVMVALARRGDTTDPVLHALVVTGLVIAVSATAFALRLASGLLERTKKPEGGA
ncbi:MAG: NADH-quinone oxidoreductase subunit K [Hydrogenophaga sp.]|jgi:multicomponent Na+:H+ antiporter subunit C|nr:NADH-quinone oxidoreductase subunit K [Hydrogenophaga sp.]